MTPGEPAASSKAAPAHWYDLDAGGAVSLLKTDARQGLSSDEAQNRLEQYGTNTIQTLKKITWYSVFARQFVDVLIIILLIAAAIALSIGEVADAVTILAIVVLNGILGFVQEWKAERAMEALQRMLVPHCKVIRDGRQQTIDATTLVPGDILLLEKGRRQYDNIQKFVRYLLSSNTGEVVAIFINILLGGPLILLPVQILWMNLITDGMTAVALGVEPPERGIMHRPPHAATGHILDRAGVIMIFILGGYIGFGTLWLFHHYLVTGHENAIATAQTAAFTGIILLEKMNVFNFRTLREPLRVIGVFSNPWVLGAWTATVGLQVCVVYVPILQHALHTVPLGLTDWMLLFAVGAPVFIITESFKWLRWRIGSVT